MVIIGKTTYIYTYWFGYSVLQWIA